MPKKKGTTSKKHNKLKIKKNENLYFLVGILIAVVILFVILGPTKTYYYQVEVPYTNIEY